MVIDTRPYRIRQLLARLTVSLLPTLQYGWEQAVGFRRQHIAPNDLGVRDTNAPKAWRNATACKLLLDWASPVTRQDIINAAILLGNCLASRMTV